MFLQTLIDIILTSWHAIAPYYVLRDFEGGVVLCCGQFARMATPGLHLKWPLIESVLYSNVVYDTHHCYDQHLTTKDGVTISIRLLVAYTIIDPRTYLLEVENAESVIADCAMNVGADLVINRCFTFCLSSEFDEQLLARARHKATQYGVEIKSVTVNQRYKFDAMFLTRTQ